MSHNAEKDAPCWCGQNHRETRSSDQRQDLDNAVTTLGHSLLAAWRIPQAVAVLDRLLHRVRFWWKTRHWNRSHGPGCPARYGDGDCLGIEDWCVFPPGATDGGGAA